MSTFTPSARIICGVVAGGLHRRSEVGPEEHVQMLPATCTAMRIAKTSTASVARRSPPSRTMQRRGFRARSAPPTSAMDASVRSYEQRQVALAHDVEVDRVKRGHHQNPRQQSVDLNRVCSTPVVAPASDAGDKCGGGRAVSGSTPRDDQDGSDGPAERDRAFGRDVGKLEDPEADEDAEGQQRQDQPDVNAPIKSNIRVGFSGPRGQAGGDNRSDPAGAAHELAFP